MIRVLFFQYKGARDIMFQYTSFAAVLELECGMKPIGKPYPEVVNLTGTLSLTLQTYYVYAGRQQLLAICFGVNLILFEEKHV